jgi:hypothetical protein
MKEAPLLYRPMPTAAPPLAPARDDAAVLTNAVTKIADYWDFSNAKLGAVLGVSPATASRLRNGQSALDPASKSFEAGQYLLRLFRSLDALLGSNDTAARQWLAAFNLDLDAKPIDTIDRFAGLIHLCDYVDAYRARV